VWIITVVIVIIAKTVVRRKWRLLLSRLFRSLSGLLPIASAKGAVGYRYPAVPKPLLIEESARFQALAV
jgi:hypothetical protein